MYHRIPTNKRALILATICEGVAVNSVVRMFKVGKPNVLRFLREVGRACEDWHNRNFRNLSVERLELDEQWAYVHTHRERMSKEDKAAHPERGDCWLWASLDPESKAIINWRTGKRRAGAAADFAGDLAARITGRVQITTDQLNSYTMAVPAAFGVRADYAQEHKIFAQSGAAGHEWMRYRTNPLVGVHREKIAGNPNLRTFTASGGTITRSRPRSIFSSITWSGFTKRSKQRQQWRSVSPGGVGL